MNLSNRLTFSLVFSVLFVAGFAFVPAVMAEEGGPTATFTIDDSPIPGDTAIPTVDGTNVLLTNANRTGLATSGMGYFRVLVSFSQPVFMAKDENDIKTAEVTNDDLGEHRVDFCSCKSC